MAGDGNWFGIEPGMDDDEPGDYPTLGTRHLHPIRRTIMDASSRQYLESEVMTATPQKLRLMLIEGAIRNAFQTTQAWERGQLEQGLEYLIRCRQIIAELLSGIRVEESDLTRKVAAVYLFLMRRLTEAQAERRADFVAEVIRVLEVERETWQPFCEKMPTAPIPNARMLGAPVEIVATSEGIGGPQRAEFSFDA